MIDKRQGLKKKTNRTYIKSDVIWYKGTVQILQSERQFYIYMELTC